MSAPEEEGPLSVGALQGAEQTPSWTGGKSDDAGAGAAVNCGPVSASGWPAEAARGRAQRGADGAAGLPCPRSHNSNGRSCGVSPDSDASDAERQLADARKFGGSAARTAFALQENVADFVQRVGLERCGFISLTFGGGGDGPSCREATKKFNSFLTGALKERYPGGIRVLERGEKRGRVHFHLLADVARDIRSGVDVEAVQRGDFRTASAALREEYAWLRRMAQRYGFGFVVNIQPVKSCDQAIAKYLAKYVAKHIGRRELRDKGTRLVGYWGHAAKHRKVCSSRFSFNSPRVKLYRWQKGEFARRNGCADLEELKEKFGARVDYWRRGEIMAIEPPGKVVEVRRVPGKDDEWVTLWDLWLHDRLLASGAVAVAMGCTQAEAYAHLFQTDLFAEKVQVTREGAARYRRVVERECEQLDADLAALADQGASVDATWIWSDGSVDKATRQSESWILPVANTPRLLTAPRAGVSRSTAGGCSVELSE